MEDQGQDFVALSERLLRNCRLAQQRVPVLRCYAEVFDPVFDLILTFHSNLTTIRHNSLREAASHEIFPLCLDLLSHPATNARLARRFPRRAITIDFVYFPLRVCRQSLLVCVHAGGGTEPHAPVPMYTKS